MERRIAYVLKAFGRTSETFITNEIYLLEQCGVPLHIFSLKTLAGQKKHGRLNAIQSSVTYLPDTEELSGASLIAWLWRNAGPFAAAHQRLLRRDATTYFAALGEALRMAFRYRQTAWAAPRKVFIKEFLQAGFIADALLQDSQIAHIHAHFCHGATTVAMFASRLSGIPFSFTAHAKDIYLQELNPGDLLPTKMRRADFVVTCTAANKEHLDGVRPTEAAQVHAIYHGLDTYLFAPDLPQDGATPKILSVGRFVEKKGFLYLVDACAVLRQRGIPFECVIVGGAGDAQSAVAARIAELHLDDAVQLRNAVTQEELRGIYAQSSIFALPCQILDNGDRDGIPNVLAEAMAMQLAVVSTNISGIPEIVHSGRNGILVPPKDALALADALTELLQDPARRRTLGAAARSTILEVFDSRTNTLRLAQMFANTVGERLPLDAAAPVTEALPC
ncbi:colanic acid biosynthesis glycosyltransferase WcaL [Bryobacterales bacterium F-183]|nr:colanic acid biosynthesis glycosyltransferase WcaL [Bryobacterales bacterium F-183]